MFSRFKETESVLERSYVQYVILQTCTIKPNAPLLRFVSLCSLLCMPAFWFGLCFLCAFHKPAYCRRLQAGRVGMLPQSDENGVYKYLLHRFNLSVRRLGVSFTRRYILHFVMCRCHVVCYIMCLRQRQSYNSVNSEIANYSVCEYKCSSISKNYFVDILK